MLYSIVFGLALLLTLSFVISAISFAASEEKRAKIGNHTQAVLNILMIILWTIYHYMSY